VKRIRVLVIDDSAFNRRTITRILEGIPDVEVAGYAVDGEEGIRRFLELKPDLVTLDIEMPRMDGFTLLRIIMHNRPTPVIIVSSMGGDEQVFRALDLGAVDFVVKPTAGISDELNKIRDDLIVKVRNVFNLNMASVRRRGVTRDVREEMPPSAKTERIPVLRHRRNADVSVVAIGASTGGPPALQTIFSALPGDMPFSVVVSQHMPSGFTRTFAERLDKLSAFDVSEARDGDRVLQGKALIAPGGSNLVFRKKDGEVTVRILPQEPTDNYLPSVDKMFLSGAEVFGPRLLGVVLTGMGNDGSKGVVAIKQAGGQVLAEAEESAVIFGMPRAAIATGVVDATLTLDRMHVEILARCGIDEERE